MPLFKTLNCRSSEKQSSKAIKKTRSQLLESFPVGDKIDTIIPTSGSLSYCKTGPYSGFWASGEGSSAYAVAFLHEKRVYPTVRALHAMGISAILNSGIPFILVNTGAATAVVDRGADLMGPGLSNGIKGFPAEAGTPVIIAVDTTGLPIAIGETACAPSDLQVAQDGSVRGKAIVNLQALSDALDSWGSLCPLSRSAIFGAGAPQTDSPAVAVSSVATSVAAADALPLPPDCAFLVGVLGGLLSIKSGSFPRRIAEFVGVSCTPDAKGDSASVAALLEGDHPFPNCATLVKQSGAAGANVKSTRWKKWTGVMRYLAEDLLEGALDVDEADDVIKSVERSSVRRELSQLEKAIGAAGALSAEEKDSSAAETPADTGDGKKKKMTKREKAAEAASEVFYLPPYFLEISALGTVVPPVVDVLSVWWAQRWCGLLSQAGYSEDDVAAIYDAAEERFESRQAHVLKHGPAKKWEEVGVFSEGESDEDEAENVAPVEAEAVNEPVEATVETAPTEGASATAVAADGGEAQPGATAPPDDTALPPAPPVPVISKNLLISPTESANALDQYCRHFDLYIDDPAAAAAGADAKGKEEKEGKKSKAKKVSKIIQLDPCLIHALGLAQSVQTIDIATAKRKFFKSFSPYHMLLLQTSEPASFGAPSGMEDLPFGSRCQTPLEKGKQLLGGLLFTADTRKHKRYQASSPPLPANVILAIRAILCRVPGASKNLVSALSVAIPKRKMPVYLVIGRGELPEINITVKVVDRKKRMTVIQGLDALHLNLTPLSRLMQQEMAASVTIGELEGAKAGVQAMKVQGDVGEDVQDFLERFLGISAHYTPPKE